MGQFPAQINNRYVAMRAWRKSAVASLCHQRLIVAESTPSGTPSRRTPDICSCGGDPVEQSLQPFFLWPHESVRRICLKNPTAPVSLREQRVGAFRAQNPFKVPDGGVNVLRRVGADPCARFCGVHVCPLRYKACFANTVHRGPKACRCSPRNWPGASACNRKERYMKGWRE